MEKTRGQSPLLKKVFKKDVSQIGLIWASGEETEIEFSKLRFECACAECVDEWTRKRKLRKDDIAADIRPLAIDPVGRYAIQVRWSDGHGAGIYTFESLYQLSKQQTSSAEDSHNVD